MFKIDVYDGSSTAQLLLWDKESVQLMGKKAIDVHVRAEEVYIKSITYKFGLSNSTLFF